MNIVNYLNSNYKKEGRWSSKVSAYTYLFLTNGTSMEWNEEGILVDYDGTPSNNHNNIFFKDIFLDIDNITPDDFWYDLSIDGFSKCYPLPNNIEPSWKEAVIHFIETMIKVHIKFLNKNIDIPNDYYKQLVLAQSLQREYNDIKEQKEKEDLLSRGWDEESINDIENRLHKAIFG